jgi:hypothetical protein
MDLGKKAADYAAALATKFLAARQKAAILEPMLSRELGGIFDNSYGAHAFIALRQTLTLDLVRDAWAFSLDADTRSPSLQNIWAMIQKPAVRSRLRAKAITPYGTKDSLDEGDWTEEEKEIWRDLWSARDIETQGKSFDDAFTRVEADLPAILSSDRAKRISQARKKTIAHYDMRASEAGAELFPLSEIGLKMNDAAKFMDETEPFIWDVVLLATWGSYDAAGFENRSRLYAADFWARLQGKPPVTEVD